MYYRISVEPSGRAANDGEQHGLLHDALSLGVSLTGVATRTLYFVQGELTAEQIDLLCARLFIDPLTETASWEVVSGSGDAGPIKSAAWVVEVGLHPGVTDPVANQIVATAAILGNAPISWLQRGGRYELSGDLDEASVDLIARRLLCNPTIQNYYLSPMPPAFPQPARSSHLAQSVSLTNLSDADLLALSRQRVLALSLDEMRAISAYFRAAGREPTDVELESLAQTWSEHCVHKTFKALVELRHGADGITRIDGLLRTYIRAATEFIHKPWVRSAFVDNAGIIDFDDQYEVSFKVETHNHPSALEPFGGANTGVGGVVRDIIGVSARPIAVTNVLCFGPQDLPMEQVPAGSLPPAPHQGRGGGRHPGLRQQIGFADSQRRSSLR